MDAQDAVLIPTRNAELVTILAELPAAQADQLG
jgi:hypothetical protein